MSSETTLSRSTQLPQVFTPQFVWATFKQWWKWIIPVAILLTACANALVFYYHIPKYKAFTRLRIKSSPDALLSFGKTRSGHRQGFTENQLAIIRSELVLEPVVEKA